MSKFVFCCLAFCLPGLLIADPTMNQEEIMRALSDGLYENSAVYQLDERNIPYPYYRTEQYRTAISNSNFYPDDRIVVTSLVDWIVRSRSLALEAAYRSANGFHDVIRVPLKAKGSYESDLERLKNEELANIQQMQRMAAVTLAISGVLSPLQEQQLLMLDSPGISMIQSNLIRKRYNRSHVAIGLALDDGQFALEQLEILRIPAHEEIVLQHCYARVGNSNEKLSPAEIKVLKANLALSDPALSSSWLRVWIRALRTFPELLQQVSFEDIVVRIAERMPEDERNAISRTASAMNPETTSLAETLIGFLANHVTEGIRKNESATYTLVKNLMAKVEDRPYVIGWLVPDHLDRFVNDPECQAFIIALARYKISVSSSDNYYLSILANAHQIFPENQAAFNVLHSDLQRLFGKVGFTQRDTLFGLS